MNDELSGTSSRSPYLGFGVVLSAYALAIIFRGNGSLEFKIGNVAGEIVISAALSLPFFLTWRYATGIGRRQPLGLAFNIFCGMTTVIWLALFIFIKSALPSFMHRMAEESTSSAAGTPVKIHQTEAESQQRSIAAEPPTYESKGWTQESTGSTEVGPWLNYSPPGTRYYRDANRTIYRVYPPGLRPNAEPANRFGLGGSSTDIQK
jgi:hypothetical protein